MSNSVESRMQNKKMIRKLIVVGRSIGVIAGFFVLFSILQNQLHTTLQNIYCVALGLLLILPWRIIKARKAWWVLFSVLTISIAFYVWFKIRFVLSTQMDYREWHLVAAIFLALQLPLIWQIRPDLSKRRNPDTQ